MSVGLHAVELHRAGVLAVVAVLVEPREIEQFRMGLATMHAQNDVEWWKRDFRVSNYLARIAIDATGNT